MGGERGSVLYAALKLWESLGYKAREMPFGER
jgi:hypothetical protein